MGPYLPLVRETKRETAQNSLCERTLLQPRMKPGWNRVRCTLLLSLLLVVHRSKHGPVSVLPLLHTRHATCHNLALIPAPAKQFVQTAFVLPARESLATAAASPTASTWLSLSAAVRPSLSPVAATGPPPRDSTAVPETLSTHSTAPCGSATRSPVA